MIAKPLVAAALVTVIGGLVLVADQSKPNVPPRTARDDGFTDTAKLPGLPWHVHDPARPHPRVVTPGDAPGSAPSDAKVLFNGKDLSQWAHRVDGKLVAPTWTVRDGYFETGKGSLHTRESFGDVQLHLEWAAPAVIDGNSQGRGNSGIFLMGLYEIQVLDSFNNRTYADGQAAAMYGQWPPLANAARRPGEWQSVRHRLRGTAVRERHASEAGIPNRVLERRGRAQPQGGHGRDGIPAGGAVHAARGRLAAHDPRSREPGALSQYLDPAAGRLR